MIVKPQQWAGEGAGAALNLAFETACELTKYFCSKQPQPCAARPLLTPAANARIVGFALCPAAACQINPHLPFQAPSSPRLLTPGLCTHRGSPAGTSPHAPCKARHCPIPLSLFPFNISLKTSLTWQPHVIPLHVFSSLYLLFLAFSIREARTKPPPRKGPCEVAARFTNVTT